MTSALRAAIYEAIDRASLHDTEEIDVDDATNRVLAVLSGPVLREEVVKTMDPVEGLAPLLDSMPPGSHIRIVKCLRYPAWNPWLVIAYRHSLHADRGHEYVEMARGHGSTVEAAAAHVCSVLDAKAEDLLGPPSAGSA